MEIRKFKEHFDKSVKLLMELTRQYCYNDIVEVFRFRIQPSGSGVHDGLNDFEKRKLKTFNRHIEELLTFEQAVARLHHDNVVPLWINATIFESKSELTVVHLLCSRRFRGDNELLYQAVKYPPFNIQVPLPPDALRKDFNGKFDVNWKRDFDAKHKSKGIWRRISQLLVGHK